MAISISKNEEQYLISAISDWSISNGLAIKSLMYPNQNVSTDSKNEVITPVPLTLSPSPFPRTCFEQALAVQRDYNHLYALISQDEDFLRGIVDE